MMNDEQKKQHQKLLTMVQSTFAVGIPTEDEIRQALTALRQIAPALTDEHMEQLFDEITATLNVRMDLGVLVQAKGHVSWLYSSKVEWKWWKAYRQWLAVEGRAPVVLDTLNDTLDTILDHMGNPQEENSWSRRGLVIGDVQSGKTGTYIGLMDKAIDVGYHVIILLTGNTEDLRKQTQERVDLGVTGRDSSRAKNQKDSRGNLVGVGPFLDSTSSVDSMTTMATDFKKTSFEAVDTILGPNKTVIFVTKKNKTVLSRIHEWLDGHRTGENKINLPMLLIDDEADYYSINTNKPEDDPTAINQAIQDILSLFSRNCYVGFTATPFANIFIDDNNAEDLFPRDFIFGLKAPTNYVGPQELFGYDSESSLVREIEDAEEVFPLGHDRYLEVDALPESLVKAIRTYLLTNAIRDLRGQTGHKTSMLINVSRLIAIQHRVYELVHKIVAEYKNAIELNSIAYLKGVAHPALAELEETFSEEFPNIEFTWEQVLRELASANTQVRVLESNSKADKAEDKPIRHISIGGDLLSRGLTLDGLSTSYFYRATRAADTLMQMGRWFGYREGYSDICRIWITDEMSSAYAHVANTLDELRAELAEMKRQQLTPDQYGLAVALHPDALLITARNKMRAAKIGPKEISLRGTAHETRTLPTERDALAANYGALERLLEHLEAQHGQSELIGSRPVWKGVDKDLVADFFDVFSVYPSWNAGIFQDRAIANFVRRAVADDLQTWDVILVGGDGSNEPTLPGVSDKYTFPIRAFGGGGRDRPWIVSGNKMRVASPGDVATTMPKEVVSEIKQQFKVDGKQKSVPDYAYVQKLSRPALIIYPIQPRVIDTDGKQLPNPKMPFPIVAVSVAIPGSRREEKDNVQYLLTTPAQRLCVPEIRDSTIDEEDDV